MNCEICGKEGAEYDNEVLGADAGPVCPDCLPQAREDYIRSLEEFEEELEEEPETP